MQVSVVCRYSVVQANSHDEQDCAKPPERWFCAIEGMGNDRLPRSVNRTPRARRAREGNLRVLIHTGVRRRFVDSDTHCRALCVTGRLRKITGDGLWMVDGGKDGNLNSEASPGIEH